MIDSHAHVDSQKFDADREAVLERTWAAGVRTLVNVGCDVASSRRSVALATSDHRIFATVGIHPHGAGSATDADWDEIVALTEAPRVVGVGECGLDRGPWNKVPLELQERLLRKHVALSRETGLPLVIHNRDTYPDLFRILEDEATRGPLRGVMHCFSGGPEDAERSVALGFFVSFSGVLTFKNAANLRAAVRVTPRDRMLVETDCPYLTPVPHRGQRNEPAYVIHTAHFLGDLLGLSHTEIEQLTVENTIRAFDLPSGAAA